MVNRVRRAGDPSFGSDSPQGTDTGTDTGKMVATALTEFTQRFSVASLDIALAGLDAANEVGTRFAKLASGILGGVADALAEPQSGKKPQ